MGSVAQRYVGSLVPGLRIEPMSPALPGRFLTPGPPGKCHLSSYVVEYIWPDEEKSTGHISNAVHVCARPCILGLYQFSVATIIT